MMVEPLVATFVLRIHDGQLILLDVGTGVECVRPVSQHELAWLEGIAASYYKIVAVEDPKHRRDAKALQRGAWAHAKALKAMGSELFDWIDGSERWLTRVREGRKQPLYLELRAASPMDAASSALLGAPWELLADAQGFLARGLSQCYWPIRRVGEPNPQHAPADRRLGVVFMASAPVSRLVSLNYEAEEHAIITAARDLNLDLEVDDSGDPLQLAQRLRNRSATHVLHLSCHGHHEFPLSTEVDSAAEPVLLMERPDGSLRRATASQLAEILKPVRPNLLFLSACSTALTAVSQDEERSPRRVHSLAAQLTDAGLDAVLGWAGPVEDCAATAFAHQLYLELSRGRSVLESVGTAARQTLNSTGPTDPGNWHLARLWVGPAGGQRLIASDSLTVAATTPNRARLGRRDIIIGRRRELQRALRNLERQGCAGLLICGLGGSGKSTLVEQIARRRPDLPRVVLHRRCDVHSLCAAIERDAGVVLPDHDDAPGAIEQALSSALSRARPLLIVFDEVDALLGVAADGCSMELPASARTLLAWLVRLCAVSAHLRLVLTTRYRFAVWEDGHDIMARLYREHLGALPASDISKLNQGLLDTFAKAHIGCAADLAAGNPGLQLHLLEAGGSSDSKIPRATVDERLALYGFRRALDRLSASEHALLRALCVFQVPISAAVLESFAAAMGSDSQPLVRECLVDEIRGIHDEQTLAYIVDPLVRGMLSTPEPAAYREQLRSVLPLWFEAHGIGLETADARDPSAFSHESCYESARLAILAEHHLLTAQTAARAVRSSNLRGEYGSARSLGLDAICVLVGVGASPPLDLYANTAEALIALGDTRQADELLSTPVPRATESRALSRFLFARGRWELRTGRVDLAVATLQEALKLHDRGTHDWATARSWLARALERQAHSDEALRIHRDEVLPTYKAMGDFWSAGAACGNIANILEGRGEVSAALEHRLNEQLPLLAAVDDCRGIAIAQGRIAILTSKLHPTRLTEEERILSEVVIPTFEALQELRELAIARVQLAHNLREQSLRPRAKGGLLSLAEQLYLKSLPVLVELGDVSSIANAHEDYAELLEQQGKGEQAWDVRTRYVSPYVLQQVAGGKVQAVSFERFELEARLREQSSPTRRLNDQITGLYLKALRARLSRVRDAGDTKEALALARQIAQLEIQNQTGSERCVASHRQAYDLAKQFESVDAIAETGRDLGVALCIAGYPDEGVPLLRQSEALFLRQRRPYECMKVAKLLSMPFCGQINTEAPEGPEYEVDYRIHELYQGAARTD